MDRPIHGAEQFRSLVSLIVRGAPGFIVGIAIVPQEGDTAGRVDTMLLPNSTGNKGAQDVAELCRKLLFHDLPDDSIPESHNGYEIIALSGQFGTNVGFIWHNKRLKGYKETIHFLADHILNSMENSKRSAFHRNFTKILSAVDSDELYKNVADTITAGLYCDEVVVWKKSGGRLTSVNQGGVDLTVSGSLAGTCITEGDQTYADIRKIDRSRIQNIGFIERKNIGSAFMFRIAESAIGSEDEGGVVGVFYHRPYGTTEIDEQLCRFAIDYYGVIWRMGAEIRELSERADNFREIEPFYKDAIKSLLDFHDLTAIHWGLSKSVQDMSVYAHDNMDAQRQLKAVRKKLNELQDLIARNKDVLSIADGFAKLISVSDDDLGSMTNLAELFDEEVDRIESELEKSRTRVSREYKLNVSSAVIHKIDFKKILSNLLTNAGRATSRRQQGGGRIRAIIQETEQGWITITIEDNGPGIEPKHLDQIYDMHFTTHGGDGGKGIGLAIVKAIAKKHGQEPKVESRWGQGAKFSVKLPFQPRT